MSTDIILDPKIRDWVLIPLTILMLLMNLGRHFAAKLMRKDRRAEPEKVKDAMTLNRAKMLGMHCYHLPRSAYRVRMVARRVYAPKEACVAIITCELKRGPGVNAGNSTRCSGMVVTTRATAA